MAPRPGAQRHERHLSCRKGISLAGKHEGHLSLLLFWSHVSNIKIQLSFPGSHTHQRCLCGPPLTDQFNYRHECPLSVLYKLGALDFNNVQTALKSKYSQPSIIHTEERERG